MKIIGLLIFLFSTNIFGEYRVYQYHIKSKNPYSFDQKSYINTATLDPVAYLAYHGGEDSLKIDLLRTWVCRGQTAGETYCPPPSQATGEGAGP